MNLFWLTIPELQTECRKRGLPDSGAKAELVQRLQIKPPELTVIKQSDKFYIKQYVGEAKARFVEVPQAKAVKLEGYENYDFFISRTVDEAGKPLPKGLWQVYEGKTGLIAGQSATTQKEAIANCLAALSARTGKLDDIIKYGIEHEGLSPRYRYG